MSWFKKLFPSKVKSFEKKGVQKVYGINAHNVTQFFIKQSLSENLEVCPKCNHHQRITARKRLDQFLDEKGRKRIG